ncbi:uncharacterized protein LOC143152879 [Ptiloglossa arizonensis]|uniref:uncharacterized protein LOC143152879 n=1 Tax=Ptiloglossa arizonensis TaxID=3350558 RepID=UPI003FA15CA7
MEREISRSSRTTIFSRLGTLGREQRPSFRRKELHNYTFERPPGRRGLRENRRPIPIRVEIACDCRPYCPHAVAVNDRLILLARTVWFLVYSCCHLIADSRNTCVQ